VFLVAVFTRLLLPACLPDSVESVCLTTTATTTPRSRSRSSTKADAATTATFDGRQETFNTRHSVLGIRHPTLNTRLGGVDDDDVMMTTENAKKIKKYYKKRGGKGERGRMHGEGMRDDGSPVLDFSAEDTTLACLLWLG
jgi:hypothetical protein